MNTNTTLQQISFSLKRKLCLNISLIIETISGLFFLLFLYAAVVKLLDYEKFTVQVAQSPILTIYASQVALLIPILEIIIAGLNIFQKTRLIGLYAAYSLMILFTAYIITILGFAERIPCSCGGILEKMGWTAHLIFNGMFVVFGLLGIILQTKMNRQKAAL